MPGRGLGLKSRINEMTNYLIIKNNPIESQLKKKVSRIKNQCIHWTLKSGKKITTEALAHHIIIYTLH